MSALGIILGFLERSWGHLGWNLEHLGNIWGHLGPSWNVLGASWKVFGRPWELPRAILEAFLIDFVLRLKQFMKIAKNLEKPMVFHWFLRSWTESGIQKIRKSR